MSKENEPYYIVEPKVKKVPFVLSIPHCGIEFPEELGNQYVAEMAKFPDDTDSYLERLYDFASELGITTIYAKYSRWVIDLNREPNNKPLYDDGRIITALCPTTDFTGQDIYTKKEFEPNEIEIKRRLDNYYFPYHRKIDEIVEGLKSEFGEVLFWDAHSIRRRVETIRKEPFPDLMLGDNEGKTANKVFTKMAFESLKQTGESVNYNDPFKGGFLTRSKGNPPEGIHALQLEMSKDLYMDETETAYDFEKAKTLKFLLKSTFENLVSAL